MLAMLTSLLLLAPCLAATYGELRTQLEDQGRLLAGDTAALVGLAGEQGCVAAHDPMDCEALKLPPPSGEPVVELIPVPALLLPALASQPASILLPRYPYGLSEPVTPVLGPLQAPDPREAWVRLPLPPEVSAPTGPARADLLLHPQPDGILVEPWAEPVAPEAPTQLVPELTAEAWPPSILPSTGLQVLLPLAPMAVSLKDTQGHALVELAWDQEAPALRGQRLVEPAWSEVATERLALAAEACQRAYQRPQRRRGGSNAPLPLSLHPPLMVIELDELGRVQDAHPLGKPWLVPERIACLRANARLLPAAPAGPALTVITPGQPVAP